MIISGGFHQRLLAGGDPPSGIIDPMEFDGDAFTDSHVAFDPHAAAAGIDFQLLSDGTWVMYKRANTFGTTQRGNWAVTPVSGIGVGYSVKFTATQTVGDATYITISNQAPGFMALTSPRRIRILLDIPSNDSDMTTFTVLVELRNNTTMDVVSGTITLNINGDQEA